MVIEIIIAVAGLTMIACMAIFATWFFFFGVKALRGITAPVAFPITVKGWGTRLAEPPPFDALIRDIAAANEAILAAAVAKGYDKAKVKAKINGLMVTWFKGTDGKRYVVDPWDRTSVGWQANDHVYVVYLPGDKLRNTAYIHEVCHAVHATKGVIDYNHVDVDMFGPGGVEGMASASLS